MKFRLCWLLLAAFLASCSGGSDSEESASTFDLPTAPIDDGWVPPPKRYYDAVSSVEIADVNEAPTSRAQTITLNGSVIAFTATAGQLIVRQDGAAHPPTGIPWDYAEAAIFYTAYTRTDLPQGTRPITFVFNGGPGGSSADLDLDFLGPKGYDETAKILTDNPNTILDRTDLVFVDPVGTGYSTAIWPKHNEDYWGVSSDAKVLHDFITRYVNLNNRQDSPKYIYGVSYGGFRAPKIARLLLQSGTSHYTSFTTDQNVVSGLVLNSPILDLTTDCYASYWSCAGAVPTYAMVADYHNKSKIRAGRALDALVADARAFSDDYNTIYKQTFFGTDQKIIDRVPWEAYIGRPEGAAFLNRLYAYTAVGKPYQLGDSAQNNPWIATPNMNPLTFAKVFDPAKGELVLSDGRNFHDALTTDPALDRTNEYYSWVQDYQSMYIGYQVQRPYVGFNGATIDKWLYDTEDDLSSLADLATSLALKPSLRVLVQHGYYDLNTVFHQSELNLGKTEDTASVPIRLYQGGHGLSPYKGQTGNYEQVMADLDSLYDLPKPPMIAALNSHTEARVNP